MHLRAYVSLESLGPLLGSRGDARGMPDVSVEFDVVPSPSAAPPTPVDATSSDLAAATTSLDADRTQERARLERELRARQPAPTARRAAAERPAEELSPLPVPEREATPTPRVDTSLRQSVTQASTDPSVAPPPDARFVARENNQVTEETVANVRNQHRDDREVSVGQTATAPTELEGNATENDSADLREREGDESRTATRTEAEDRRPEREAAPASPASTVAAGDGASAGRARIGDGASGSDARGGQAGGTRATSGARAESTTMRVHDGFGAFEVVRQAPSRRSEGLGVDGLAERAGSGEGEAGRGRGIGLDGNGRQGLRGQGSGFVTGGPREGGIAWSAFEQFYGADELERQREAYVAQRRSKARGGSREQRWRQFRAAIENYVPNVRPGNQTALRTAASPFADYLAEVHRRIHRQFAEQFLANLPAGAGPYADPTLMTKLEIIFNRDGTVHRVGVIETSGFLPYDFGAFASVMRAQPYPEAPAPILSGDGRVYVHWAFYRNERQCGTFNAEPFLLPHPPDTPRGPSGPLQDAPAMGGVVPRDARGAGDGTEAPSPQAPPRGAPAEPAPDRPLTPAPTGPAAPPRRTPVLPPPTDVPSGALG